MISSSLMMEYTLCHFFEESTVAKKEFIKIWTKLKPAWYLQIYIGNYKVKNWKNSEKNILSHQSSD